MALMVVCGALLAAGVILAVVWGGERVVAPAPQVPHTASDESGECERGYGARGIPYYLWWATVFTLAGTVTGVLVTGAGGRLVMRVLAATSPESRNFVTEAQALVGRITLEGTIGYLIFGAFPLAFMSALVFLLVEPWLPPGRWGGPVFGMLSLVVVAPVIDPLRPDNIDFVIVGPGWLAVALFAALAVVHGALLAAVAGRVSRTLPIMTRRNWSRTAPPLLVAIVLTPIAILIAIGAIVVASFPDLLPWLVRVRARPLVVRVGRIAIGALVLVATPSFVSAVVSISTAPTG